MVQTLEVTSQESTPSCDLDVRLDVTASAADEKGASATSRSWKRRLLLVAAPFCAGVFAYIGVQVRGVTADVTKLSPAKVSLLEGITGGKEDVLMEDRPGGEKVTKERAAEAAQDIVEAIAAEGISLETVRRNDFLLNEELMTLEITKLFKSFAIKSMRATDIARDDSTIYWLMSFADIVEKLTRFLTEKKGLRFRAVTVHQPLMGDEPVGHIHEIIFNGAYRAMNVSVFECKDMVAKSQDFLFSSTHFVPTDEFPEQVETLDELWPGFSPVAEAEAEAGHENSRWARSVKTLQENNVKRVHLTRDAMGILLGSSFWLGAVAATWKCLTTSAFGMWTGDPDAGDEAVSKGTDDGWMASELLEGRVRNHFVPLVLDKWLQSMVLFEHEEERSSFVSRLRPGRREEGGVAQSAYVVIASLFDFVRELSEAGIVTMLDMNFLFTGAEIRQVLLSMQQEAAASGQAALATKAQRGIAWHLIRLAGELERDPGAARMRRSGPRFLLHCLLLLEKRSEGDLPAAEYLHHNILRALDTDLLQALRQSRLKIWRRSTIKFDGVIPWGVFRPGDGQQEGFELIPAVEFLEMRSAIESAMRSFLHFESADGGDEVSAE